METLSSKLHWGIITGAVPGKISTGAPTKSQYPNQVQPYEALRPQVTRQPILQTRRRNQHITIRKRNGRWIHLSIRGRHAKDCILQMGNIGYDCNRN